MTNGKRDYKKENEKYKSKPKERHKRVLRTVARRRANASGLTHKGDGNDLDHIKPLSKGGSNSSSNLRVRSASANRSFARTKSGKMK